MPVNTEDSFDDPVGSWLFWRRQPQNSCSGTWFYWRCPTVWGAFPVCLLFFPVRICLWKANYSQLILRIPTNPNHVVNNCKIPSAFRWLLRCKVLQNFGHGDGSTLPGCRTRTGRNIPSLKPPWDKRINHPSMWKWNKLYIELNRLDVIFRLMIEVVKKNNRTSTVGFWRQNPNVYKYVSSIWHKPLYPYTYIYIHIPCIWLGCYNLHLTPFPSRPTAERTRNGVGRCGCRCGPRGFFVDPGCRSLQWTCVILYAAWRANDLLKLGQMIIIIGIYSGKSWIWIELRYHQLHQDNSFCYQQW